MTVLLFFKALAFVVLILAAFFPAFVVMEFCTFGIEALRNREPYVTYAKASLFVITAAVTVMAFVAIAGLFIGETP